MRFDRFGIGYSAAGGTIEMHYPIRAADGSITHGAGIPIEIPARYWTDPPNAITAERVAIWGELLGRSAEGA